MRWPSSLEKGLKVRPGSSRPSFLQCTILVAISAPSRSAAPAEDKRFPGRMHASPEPAGSPRLAAPGGATADRFRGTPPSLGEPLPRRRPRPPWPRPLAGLRQQGGGGDLERLGERLQRVERRRTLAALEHRDVGHGETRLGGERLLGELAAQSLGLEVHREAVSESHVYT